MNIVQIGSNDCFTCDDCFKFVEENHEQVDNIVCVDPNIDKLSNCLKVYENFDIEVRIIARVIITDPNQKTAKLYYSDVEKNGHHTSFNREHLKTMGWEDFNIYTKEHLACTANQLFGMTGFKTIDRLYVDTEGYDLNILESIDYAKYDIRWIRFETAHTKMPIHEYYRKVKQLGYNHRHGNRDAEVWKDE